MPDWRHGPVRHSLETLVRQRIFQITCGYADQSDADTLRLRLIKIGGWERQLLRQVRLHLADHQPARPLWHLLSTRLGRL